MKNNIYRLLGLARRAGKVSFGSEACIDAIERNKAKLVIIAEDASEKTKKNFEELCKKRNVVIKKIGTTDELSKSIGQNNKVIVVVRDENFAKEIIKRIDGGEIIG